LTDVLLSKYGDTPEKAARRKTLLEQANLQRAYGMLAEEEARAQRVEEIGRGGISDQDLEIFAALMGTAPLGMEPELEGGLDPEELAAEMDAVSRVREGIRPTIDPLTELFRVRGGGGMISAY
jgi:hypothetical protein